MAFLSMRAFPARAWGQKLQLTVETQLVAQDLFPVNTSAPCLMVRLRAGSLWCHGAQVVELPFGSARLFLQRELL